jgi:hypothetical protein
VRLPIQHLFNRSTTKLGRVFDGGTETTVSPPSDSKTTELRLHQTQVSSCHSCGTKNAGLEGHCGQKPRKRALLEPVKPYLDTYSTFGTSSPSDSNPLTPTGAHPQIRWETSRLPAHYTLRKIKPGLEFVPSVTCHALGEHILITGSV